MSEIALQGLLDRTKADEQDEEAMDMTVINGVRMSKYDIRALKVGLKVTPEMLKELTESTVFMCCCFSCAGADFTIWVPEVSLHFSLVLFDFAATVVALSFHLAIDTQ
jgi:hypothetical protein